MRRREAAVGLHVYHHPTGAYLGVISALGEHLLYFEGPRRRDGHPVTFAAYGEVVLGAAPVGSSGAASG